MIKKAFLKNLMFKYIEDNDLKTVEEVLLDLPNMYKFVKAHPENPMPTIKAEDFMRIAHESLELAKSMQGNMFNFSYGRK